MATTSNVPGNAMKLYIGSNFIGCTTEDSFELAMEIIETVCKDNDGARQIKPGGISGSFTTSGIWAFDSTYGVEDVFDAFLAKTPVTIVFKTASSGDFNISASAYVTSFSGSATVNENVTFDATWTITGAVTKGTNA